MLKADSSWDTNGWNWAASSRERTNWASAGLNAVNTVTSAILPQTCRDRGQKSRGDCTLQIGEDYDARPSLELALDLDFDLLADRILGVIDHDHRPVRQVADALALVLALAHDAQA